MLTTVPVRGLDCVPQHKDFHSLGRLRNPVHLSPCRSHSSRAGNRADPIWPMPSRPAYQGIYRRGCRQRTVAAAMPFKCMIAGCNRATLLNPRAVRRLRECVNSSTGILPVCLTGVPSVQRVGPRQVQSLPSRRRGWPGDSSGCRSSRPHRAANGLPAGTGMRPQRAEIVESGEK